MTTREPWKLSLVVNVDVDIIVNVVSSGKLGSEFGISHSNDVMSVDALGVSVVSSAIKVALVRPGKLLLEGIDMSLRNRIDRSEDIPVNILATRRLSLGSLVDVSVVCVNHVHQISECDKRLHWVVGLCEIN